MSEPMPSGAELRSARRLLIRTLPLTTQKHVTKHGARGVTADRQRRVLMEICNLESIRNECYASNKHFGTETGVTDRHASAAIAVLEKQKLIRVTRQTGYRNRHAMRWDGIRDCYKQQLGVAVDTTEDTKEAKKTKAIVNALEALQLVQVKRRRSCWRLAWGTRSNTDEFRNSVPATHAKPDHPGPEVLSTPDLRSDHPGPEVLRTPDLRSDHPGPEVLSTPDLRSDHPGPEVLRTPDLRSDHPGPEVLRTTNKQPLEINKQTTTTTSQSANAGSADRNPDPWVVVVSELFDLGMGDAAGAVETAKQRNRTIDEVREFIAEYRQAKAQNQQVDISWLHRWISGKSRPVANKPKASVRVSSTNPAMLGELLRARVVKEHCLQGESEEVIAAMVQAKRVEQGANAAQCPEDAVLSDLARQVAPPEQQPSQDWEEAQAKLSTLGVKEWPRAIEAVKARGFPPSFVLGLAKQFEQLRKTDRNVTPGYLYRWCTGDSDPPPKGQALQVRRRVTFQEVGF